MRSRRGFVRGGLERRIAKSGGRDVTEEQGPEPIASGSDPTGQNHPEREFVFKALATIALVLVLESLLRPFMGILLVLSPLIFLVGIRLHAIANDQDPNQLLREYLTVTPFIRPEGDSRFEGVAWVTYGLISANVLIYYVAQPLLGNEFIGDNLVFYPFAPTPINVPASAVASLFLHGSDAHLWGNLVFLWRSER